MALRLPTAAAKGLLEITPSFLRTLGVKAILLDVDNTLSHHGSQTSLFLIIPKNELHPLQRSLGYPLFGEPASQFPSDIKRLPSSWGYGAVKL